MKSQRQCSIRITLTSSSHRPWQATCLNGILELKRNQSLGQAPSERIDRSQSKRAAWQRTVISTRSTVCRLSASTTSTISYPSAMTARCAIGSQRRFLIPRPSASSKSPKRVPTLLQRPPSSQRLEVPRKTRSLSTLTAWTSQRASKTISMWARRTSRYTSARRLTAPSTIPSKTITLH